MMITKTVNSHLFEEQKETPAHLPHNSLLSSPQTSLVLSSQPVTLPSNAIMGFGGIPITYTMNMRQALPALIPDGQSYSVWQILKSAIG